MTKELQNNNAEPAIKVVHRVCPLCAVENSTNTPSSYSLPPWMIQKCKNCSFVYIDSAPHYEHLKVEMAWDVTYAKEIIRKTETRKISYKLSGLTRKRLGILPKRKISWFINDHHKGGRIVDLGCGTGGLIEDLCGTFEPYGVEISAALAEKANNLFRQYGGQAVCAPSLLGLQEFPPDYFEVAVMRSYLEHELEPLGVLKQVFRVLKPGGIAIVKVPNFGSLNRMVMGKKWCGFRYPDHLNYFTRGTLRKMAKASGFHIKFNLWGSLPTSDNMWAVFTKLL